MHLLQITDAFTHMVQTGSAIIAIVIAFYFLAAYKKYSDQMERNELLDHFLND